MDYAWQHGLTINLAHHVLLNGLHQVKKTKAQLLSEWKTWNGESQIGAKVAVRNPSTLSNANCFTHYLNNPAWAWKTWDLVPGLYLSAKDSCAIQYAFHSTIPSFSPDNDVNVEHTVEVSYNISCPSSPTSEYFQGQWLCCIELHRWGGPCSRWGNIKPDCQRDVETSANW